MSSELSQIATQLMTDLDLTSPPIQISYLESPPTGVPAHPGGSPSVCTFFAEGQQRAFYADTKAHEACEVGAFVLGIPPEGELGTRVMGMIGLMQKEGYLHAGEEAKVPHNAKAPRYVAYGPLGSLPAPPTSVLLFAPARSAMLAMEAAPQGPVPMNGRPMCAIVPTLNDGAKVALSLSCVGSRIFTQMPDDQVVVGIRGDYLSTYAADVRRVRRANDLIGKENWRRREAATHPYHAPT